MPTYLNLLQVVENLDDVLTDHERIVSVLYIKIVPLVTKWICLDLLSGHDGVFDLFFV